MVDKSPGPLFLLRPIRFALREPHPYISQPDLPFFMDFVTPAIAEIAPSITLAVTAQAAKMKKEGIDVCSFGAGEPDMDTPDYIKNAAVAALAAGKTKYTASAGLLELREAICAKLKADNGLVQKICKIIEKTFAN